MTTTTATAATASVPAAPVFHQPPRRVLIARYLRRNKSLAVGLGIVLFLALFTVVGTLTIDTTKRAYPLAVKTKQPPSVEFPLGTDWYGRDLLAAMVRGLWQTAIIGLLAGAVATAIGVVLGFISAYYGGAVDRIITGICQVLQPIPAFLIQVIVASSIDKRSVTIYTMALVIVLLAWMGPTLVIRSQVLSMKERQFVSVAKLSGMSNLEIIFKELLPNLLPFIAASFVGAVFGALFASFGLSVLGLGPLREPLIGNTIYFSQQQSAIFNGWWWWPLWPILALVLIFSALTLINIGLDEIANPRVRRTE
jgi:peptide/nickel transport system permease protein